jgi:septal ring factor EnvC (AmiA/AmiB activator)
MQARVALAFLLSFGLSGCDVMQRFDLMNAQLASTNAKISKTNSHLTAVKHDTAGMDQKLAETNARLEGGRGTKARECGGRNKKSYRRCCSQAVN